ncbi:unnamed protein product [Dicrocoelium dendriticum]|nr:unnamed protein product [Dicrocoelium dendriticum]
MIALVSFMRIALLCFMFWYNLPVSLLIGPGLTRYHSRTDSDDTTSWDSAPLSFGSDGNAYAYWNCHLIPPNMTLCKSVGYSRMVLPNFLQHESIREVIQQANVWVALVNTNCHADIQRFLCSLYAPVCLKSHQEAKIPPCWELCDQVRTACLPRMRLFGFDWPEIVQCSKFPKLAESMCIPPQEVSTVQCAPCEQAITLENIASSYCMADVVLRASLRDVTLNSNGASLKLLPSSRTQAFKLLRRDGTISTSFDPKHWENQNRQRKVRHRLLRSRMYRHIEPNRAEDTMKPASSVKYPVPQMENWLTRARRSKSSGSTSWVGPSDRSRSNGLGKRNAKRRRRVRNSHLSDIDGITELQLSCSACSGLSQFNTASEYSGMNSNRWLIMGRRIPDAKTKTFTNQVQVTFLALWDRDSQEFRKALHTIRTQPIAQLCPKNSALALDLAELGDAVSTRNLKILRSAPSELSDAPNTVHKHGEQRVHPLENRVLGTRNESIVPNVTNLRLMHIKPTNQPKSIVGISNGGEHSQQLISAIGRHVPTRMEAQPYGVSDLTPGMSAWKPNQQHVQRRHTSSESQSNLGEIWQSPGSRWSEERPNRWIPVKDIGKVGRGRRGREGRQGRRKPKESRRHAQYVDLHEPQWKPPVKQEASAFEHAPLRQHPINPYVNEEPISYASPFWYP